MPLLSAFGTLSYNGYTFDGASEVTVSVEFVEDEARRTVLFHRHTIRVKSTVAESGGTNATLGTIRARLSEAGKQLVFIQQGFGNDLIVNAPGGRMRDVEWGPKPTVLSWSPIGSYQACEIEWQVVVSVPHCLSAGQTRYAGIMSINYGASYSLDARGYTTRTIAGHLVIAQTRVGSSVPDTADAYLSAIAPTLPTGFRRSQSRQLSPNKSRLDFTIIDEQIPSPVAWPVGIVAIDGRHSVAWSRRGGAAGWVRHRISLRTEVAADYPASWNYFIFADLVGRRIEAAKKSIASKGRKHVLLDELSMEEDIFGRGAQFSVGYRTTQDLASILEESGLWTPIGTDWRYWRSSMAATFGARGHAGLQHLPGNDAIIDLCGAAGTLPWNADRQRPSPVNSPKKPAFANEVPHPDESWLWYDSWVETYRERPVARQSPLQAPDSEGTVTAWNPSASAGVHYRPNTASADVLSESGRSQYWASLYGYALRAGHRIPRPFLTSVSSADAKELDGSVAQKVVANWLGVPIFASKWRINYMLTTSPEEVDAESNPREKLDGRGRKL